MPLWVRFDSSPVESVSHSLAVIFHPSLLWIKDVSATAIADVEHFKAIWNAYNEMFGCAMLNVLYFMSSGHPVEPYTESKIFYIIVLLVVLAKDNFYYY